MATLAIAAALTLSTIRGGRAQSVDPNFWVANGPVASVVRDGSTIYIGGNFTRVGPASGGGVPLDASTAAPLANFPKVAGVVRAIVPDGTGGWYLGGSFTSVGGLPRNNVARVSASMSVTSWNPNATGQYGYVDAIVPSGSLVYVGGSFSSIGGQTRNNLAAIDTTTGLATSWDPNPNSVLAMVADGGTIYVGGKFTTIGGQLRNRIAAFNASTGTVIGGWKPDADSDVYALAISGSALYVGGTFDSIGGAVRNGIAALHLAPSSGAAFPWNPNASQPVRALAVSGSIVYAGGDFVTIGGQSRRAIAALDAATGTATSWNANSNGPIYAIGLAGSVVYAGGNFTSIGGQARNSVAALDTASALATTWNPDLGVATVDPVVNALGVAGATVYVGGDIVTVGGQARNNIAALSAVTGAVTPWNPNANAQINALSVTGGAVYAAGGFGTIGGQTRAYIAALDRATGLATPWNPNANDKVDALTLAGSTVYVGGRFTNIGGQPRNYVAALDTASGLATSWNPDADNFVGPLAISGSTVYAAGSFTHIGGQNRHYVAALDATSGAATSWDALAGDVVSALALQGANLYVGGDFVTIGGQSRNHIAALSVTTAAATTWNPNADNPVRVLAANGTALYAGGLFTSIGGQSRSFVAALDVNTGSATAWNPGINPSDGFTRVWPAGPSRPFSIGALATGTTVYLGGDFLGAGGFPQAFVSATEPALAIFGVAPPSGGNAAAVTPTITGVGLKPGATVRLTRSGQADIVGTGTSVATDGLSLSATFDLTAKALGAWDVVITNPDAQTATLANGFTIEGLSAPELRVDVVGPNTIRANYPAAFDFVIENQGNVDALSVPLWITGIPTSVTNLSLAFTSSPPPSGAGEPSWAVQDTFTSANGRYLAVVIPRVPPGLTTRRLVLTVPGSVSSFQLGVATTPPWTNDLTFLTCLSNAGVIQSIACVGAQLDTINTYLAANPQLAALNGIGLWARIGWRCEGAGTLPAAIAEARQTLDYLVQRVELGTAPGGCSDALLPRWRQARLVAVVSSIDPNEKSGPVGAIHHGQTLTYTVWFENQASASGYARDVIVEDVLATTLDLNSVRLLPIRVGTLDCSGPNPPCLPGGTIPYSGDIDLSGPTRVRVTVDFAPPAAITRKLVWRFSTLNDSDGLPPSDPSVGFLPPNVTAPQGEGSVQFTVVPSALTPDGTPVQNGATITMDTITQSANTVSNTLDDTPPQSNVMALSSPIPSPGFTVSWAAPNPPPDLKDFTIYFAEDGGPDSAWKEDVTATSATFTPRPGGHGYTFYSRARDNSLNVEPKPTVPDAQTLSTTAVESAADLSLALHGAQPNPAIGILRVEFTLPSREAASLELIDIAGRRVLRREIGELGPGRHVVTLNPSPRLRAGLYFLRLAQGDRRLQSKVVIMK